MLKQMSKKASLKRTNPLLTHNISNSKRTILSPLNLKSLSRQNTSTSPSPNKHSCLTPRRQKLKKAPSKLFKKAHETDQGQTYLQGNSSIQHFSSAKVTVFRDTLRSHPKVCPDTKLTIQSVYNITIFGSVPSPSSQSLSEIIRRFETVEKENGLANITENSDELLELNSKVEESKACSQGDICV